MHASAGATGGTPGLLCALLCTHARLAVACWDTAVSRLVLLATSTQGPKPSSLMSPRVFSPFTSAGPQIASADKKGCTVCAAGSAKVPFDATPGAQCIALGGEGFPCTQPNQYAGGYGDQCKTCDTHLVRCQWRMPPRLQPLGLMHSCPAGC